MTEKKFSSKEPKEQKTKAYLSFQKQGDIMPDTEEPQTAKFSQK